jgi:UDP-galactose transporter B1
VFVFLTIAKFGALNCALIGLCRKMLSLVLSFVLYGHSINAIQSVGLGLAIASMLANFYEKVFDFFTAYFKYLKLTNMIYVVFAGW